MSFKSDLVKGKQPNISKDFVTKFFLVNEIRHNLYLKRVVLGGWITGWPELGGVGGTRGVGLKARIASSAAASCL